MKVLVTGGTGFAGSHTARVLAGAGHDVRLLVRDAAKVRTVYEPFGNVPDDIVVGDMTDAGSADEALRGCDGVVHAAALVDLRRTAAARVEEANARGVELVVGGAASRGLPSIVHVSSLGVFFVPGGPPLSPDLPIAPGTTAYARSKAKGEVYVRRLQEQGASIRISYPASILGPDDPGPSAVTEGLAASMRHAWLITSGGIQVVDVRDLAAMHLALLELPTGAHRYAAAGDMLGWSEVYQKVCEITGTRPRGLKIPGAALRAAGSVGDAIKRIRDFDFHLTRDAMEYTTRWPGADVERTTRDLDIDFRDATETFRDTLTWLYQAGHLSAAQVGKLAQPRPD
jgi:nucleoside-diphosphate-sugar epimerase